jgi:hypothetical protein
MLTRLPLRSPHHQTAADNAGARQPHTAVAARRAGHSSAQITAAACRPHVQPAVYFRAVDKRQHTAATRAALCMLSPTQQRRRNTAERTRPYTRAGFRHQRTAPRVRKRTSADYHGVRNDALDVTGANAVCPRVTSSDRAVSGNAESAERQAR